MPFRANSILGINARNLLYIKPFNAEKNVEIADDKLKTKAFLSAREIPVPKLLGSIENNQQLLKFKWSKLGHEFVIKPNLGYGGEGIIPITYKENGFYFTAKGARYSEKDLIQHVREILSGNFAISDKPDKALFEKLIVTDEILGKYSSFGLPDIRIIVHKMVPVMAMLRLPTVESNGKANLHQGAVGAGIDIAKGEVTHLIHHGKIVKEVPGKGSLKGLKIPFWEEVLRIACKAQLVSNLGYLGADIAIDKTYGPVLLEINARAGIGIQLANLTPLRKRLEQLADINVNSVEKGIRIGKDLFGYSIEKNIKTISGKKVIGLFEKVEFIDHQMQTEAIAFINTSRKKNYLSTELAKQLGLIKSKKAKDLDTVRATLKYRLNGKKLISSFKIDKNIKKKYQVVIGNKDITGNFLIDTSINNFITEKNTGKKNNIFVSHYNPIETDRQICRINNQMKFLSHLRPINQKEELTKFLQDNNYNPQFKYHDYAEEYEQTIKNLKKIHYDDSDLGYLFKERIDELALYAELIKARGSSEFTQISARLFGIPTAEDLATLSLKKIKHKKEEKNITSEQLKLIFEEKIREYGLKYWKVNISKRILTHCITNKNKHVILRNDLLFNKSRAEELIIHELETHLLTNENGSRQKYKLFQLGFANYLETQEGLAIYNIRSRTGQLEQESPKNRLIEAIYLSTNNTFSELYKILRSKRLTKKAALNICLRVKRGLHDTASHGAFTKDYLYHSGYQSIKKYVEEGGDLRDLYFGKYNLKDLPYIKNINSLNYDQIILPSWLK